MRADTLDRASEQYSSLNHPRWHRPGYSSVSGCQSAGLSSLARGAEDGGETLRVLP